VRAALGSSSGLGALRVLASRSVVGWNMGAFWKSGVRHVSRSWNSTAHIKRAVSFRPLAEFLALYRSHAGSENVIT